MQIINATQIVSPRLCALIYGAPGAGKTSLLKYLPGRTKAFLRRFVTASWTPSTDYAKLTPAEADHGEVADAKDIDWDE